MAQYGPQDGYGQPYQPRPPHAQHQPLQPPEPQSQALAVVALVAGVVACGLTLLPAARGVAVVAGLAAAALAAVALVSRRQGGMWLAIIGLIAGMVALPLAFALHLITSGSSNEQQVRDLQACIEADPGRVLECTD